MQHVSLKVSKNIIYEATIIYNKRASGNIHGLIIGIERSLLLRSWFLRFWFFRSQVLAFDYDVIKIIIWVFLFGMFFEYFLACFSNTFSHVLIHWMWVKMPNCIFWNISWSNGVKFFIFCEKLFEIQQPITIRDNNLSYREKIWLRWLDLG